MRTSPLSLTSRSRRLRLSESIRDLVREQTVEVRNLILPLFVSEKLSDKVTGRQAIKSMPGVEQLSLSELVKEAVKAHESGIRAVLLFGIPAEKNSLGSGAYHSNGIIPQAIRALKKEIPDLVVITDICLCEYTDHGHCGVVSSFAKSSLDTMHYEILNDESVEFLTRIALSHAEAGADIVAPSDMMDGRIGAIRSALDSQGFIHTSIMSYAAKFASAFYGPFREAAEGAPQFGDRRSYQMDPANALEALREVEQDIDESADMIIVKPGLPYLDILWRVKEKFGRPTAVYNVSGEYAMIKAAAANGWIDERAAVMELMTSFKRAGADLIITYWAREIANWLKE